VRVNLTGGLRIESGKEAVQGSPAAQFARSQAVAQRLPNSAGAGPALSEKSPSSG
jgi:hypothetical protein